MNPVEQNPAVQNEQLTPAPERKKMSGRTKAALWLMIGPTALMIMALLAYFIINFVFSGVADSTTTSSDGLFAEQSNPGDQVISIANILLFLVGALVTLTWLPGLIIGIVLLATKKQGQQSA